VTLAAASAGVSNRLHQYVATPAVALPSRRFGPDEDAGWRSRLRCLAPVRRFVSAVRSTLVRCPARRGLTKILLPNSAISHDHPSLEQRPRAALYWQMLRIRPPVRAAARSITLSRFPGVHTYVGQRTIDRRRVAHLKDEDACSTRMAVMTRAGQGGPPDPAPSPSLYGRPPACSRGALAAACNRSPGVA